MASRSVLFREVEEGYLFLGAFTSISVDVFDIYLHSFNPEGMEHATFSECLFYKFSAAAKLPTRTQDRFAGLTGPLIEKVTPNIVIVSMGVDGLTVNHDVETRVFLNSKYSGSVKKTTKHVRTK